MPKQKLFTTPRRNETTTVLVNGEFADRESISLEPFDRDKAMNKVYSYKELFGDNAKLPKTVK